MTESLIKPLGNRVLIKPHPKRTETASGLAIVEDWQPDTGGVVVALGDGIESRKKAVLRFADHAIERVRVELGEEAPSAEAILSDLMAEYRPEHVCQVGDEVTFGVAAGTELDLGGELYLLVNEDDLETICEPIEAAV